MKKTISFRALLLRSFIMLTVMLSVIILIMTFVIAEKSAISMCHNYTGQASNEAELRLNSFIIPTVESIKTASELYHDGVLTCSEESFNGFFSYVLSRIDNISGISVAMDDGRGSFFTRDIKSGYIHRHTTPELIDSGLTHWHYFDSSLTLILDTVKSICYNPTTRPWYTVTKEFDSLYATDPYIFASTGELGITYAIKTTLPSGELFVISYDILISEISKFTTNYRPTTNGKIILSDPKKGVVGLPADFADSPDSVKRSYYLKSFSSFNLPEIKGIKRLKGDNSAINISVDGEKWLIFQKRITLPANRDEILTLLIPERDIYKSRNLQTATIILVTIFVIIFAALLSFLLSKKYSAPLQKTVEMGIALRNLNTKHKLDSDSPIREIQELTSVQESMRIALDAFTKYMPVEVVHKLLKTGEVAKLGGRTAEIVVLFTDINNFTALAEIMTPQQLIEFMEPYFSGMLEILQESDATVDKIIGDGVMAFWGAPNQLESPELNAIRAVEKCISFEKTMNMKLINMGLPTITTRFGVAKGEAVVGNVGAKERMNYTAMGDVVNIAARLESVNKEYGTNTIVTDGIAKCCGDSLFRHLNRIKVKGREKSVEIYEYVGIKSELTQRVIDNTKLYNSAIDALLNGDKGQAIKILESLPKDRAVEVTLKQLQEE